MEGIRDDDNRFAGLQHAAGLDEVLEGGGRPRIAQDEVCRHLHVGEDACRYVSLGRRDVTDTARDDDLLNLTVEKQSPRALRAPSQRGRSHAAGPDRRPHDDGRHSG